MKNLSENNLLLVSVIIPCRNEKRFIIQCLDSVISQDYPKDKIEILIIEGMSEDGTREIVKKYIDKYFFIKLVNNPRKFTNFAFNIGVKEAKGDVVMIMGAHAIYQGDYISKCIKYLNEYNADNVGGIVITFPQENTVVGRAIALVLSSPFGVGGSTFRKGSKSPKWVDTVFGGCYKREVFEKIGLFNENLVRSQDMEFNLRLKKAGGKILLIPEIVSYYYVRSNFKDFFVHNFRDGIWAIYPLKFVKMPLCLRHYIPLIFVSSLIGTGLLGIFLPVFFWLFLFIISLYLLVNFYFSVKIMIREKDWRYLFLVPVAFVCRHLAYGLGSILGVIKLFK